MLEKSKVIYNFASQVTTMLGKQLKTIILYGSYARGDQREDSDVDIMILVDMTEEEMKAIRYPIYDLAFDIFMETGVDISPVIENENRYQYWIEDLPYFRNIHTEGIVLNG